MREERREEERGVDYDATCCPVLWTIYLLFETLELPVMFSLTLRRLQCVHRI